MAAFLAIDKHQLNAAFLHNTETNREQSSISHQNLPLTPMKRLFNSPLFNIA